MATSRRFSIPTFVRMVPNEHLKQFFERLGHGDLGLVWDDLKPREIEPVIQAVGKLDRKAQDRMEGEMRSIFGLADDNGVDAMVEGATRCGERNLAESMPAQVPCYVKAVWMWLNRPEAFQKALVIHKVEHLSWWRKRNDIPLMKPDMSTTAREKLEREFAALLTKSQGRGKVCTVETFERGETVYFIAHADDFVQNATVHDAEGKLTPLVYRSTFESVFAFNPKEGTLALHARLPPNLKRKLEESFAQTILGISLGPWDPDAAYVLNHLLDPSFKFETDAEDCLRVRLVKMRLCPKNSGRRILIEIDEEDGQESIHKAMDECLHEKRLARSEVWANQVTLRFQFHPLGNRKPGSITVVIGWPNSCSGLHHERAERVALVHKYFKRWNIDSVQPATPDLAAAGNGAADSLRSRSPAAAQAALG